MICKLFLVSNEKRVERGGQTVKYIFLNTSGRIVSLVLGSMTFTSAAKVLIMTAFFQFIRKDSVKRPEGQSNSEKSWRKKKQNCRD